MLRKSEGYFVWKQSEKKSENMIIFWLHPEDGEEMLKENY